MDPFVVIRNYRHRGNTQADQPVPLVAPRIFLRQLDPNALVSRQSAPKPAAKYCQDDKQNYFLLMDMDLGDDLMKKLPTPNQFQLINYSDYDFTY